MNPLTGVFAESWQLFKAHWRHFFVIALVVFLFVAVLSALLVGILGVLGALLAILVSLAGSFWLQGALAEAVRDVRDGRADLSVRQTFDRVLPHANRITVAALLAGAGVGVGIILFIVPGLFLLTFWLVVVPAIVLEGRGTTAAFGRSWQLVSGNGWNVFLVIVLSIILLLGLSLAVEIVLVPFADWLAQLVSRLVVNTLVGPYVAVTWTLVYYRLRAVELERLEPSAPRE